VSEELMLPINLLSDVIIFGFICGLPPCLPPYFLFLGCGVAGEMNDRFFSSSRGKNERRSAIHFLSN
jgi:hypothetical protein